MSACSECSVVKDVPDYNNLMYFTGTGTGFPFLMFLLTPVYTNTLLLKTCSITSFLTVSETLIPSINTTSLYM